MAILMSGLEHSLAGIALREKLSFTKVQTGQILGKIREIPGVSGCVLISTCNRTELYLSCGEDMDPGQLLCQAAHTEYAPYAHAFVRHRGEAAVRHLMEVAAGLRSRIWGEDQIISQVKNAITLAREAGTADSVLETLFRWAVSAGKEVRTSVHLTALPTSAAAMAVELVQKKMGGLQGKKAMVIGNGEMGRLSAALLQAAGAETVMTLRSYRHGETVVPAGCGVVPYEERFSHMEGTDLLISATTSPHYTVTREQLEEVKQGPGILVDLAIPRDIQPEAGTLPGVTLLNVDDLGDFLENRTVPQEVTEILNAHMEHFYRWFHYRECMGTAESLKNAVMERLFASGEADEDTAEAMETAVSKTVDLLLGGMAERITPESLAVCESKIRQHTIGRRGGV